MPIPDFQAIMLPLLELARDQGVHTTQEAYQHLATHFRLSDAEKNELLPSGKQPTFENRVLWAKFYLDRAGLLESPSRGKFRITADGIRVLTGNPGAINEKLLLTFPKFAEWRRAGKAAVADEDKDLVPDRTKTPEESLETSYVALRETLTRDVLGKIKSCSPRFFEQLVVDLLLRMGYGGSLQAAGQVVGRSGDGGIDGVIKEDKLGLDVVYVQAKRWESSVGRPDVQKFAGSLLGHGARKGVMITTSSFTSDAREYVKTTGDQRIVLIDGEELARLVVDHDVGVSVVNTYAIKKIDSDYFEEE
jgi:restriction system protein